MKIAIAVIVAMILTGCESKKPKQYNDTCGYFLACIAKK